MEKSESREDYGLDNIAKEGPKDPVEDSSHEEKKENLEVEGESERLVEEVEDLEAEVALLKQVKAILKESPDSASALAEIFGTEEKN